VTGIVDARPHQGPTIGQVATWAVTGGTLVAGSALFLGRHGELRTATRLARGFVGGAVFSGALAGIDALLGRPLASGLHVARTHSTDRHQFAFVARNVVSAPWLYPTARRVRHDAEREQVAVYHTPVAIDDAGDAYRHAWASAALVVRIVEQRGWSIDDATDLARRAGEAHERDGADNPAGRASAEMDLANNEVGFGIARDLLAVHPSGVPAAALRASVLDAIAGGRLVVLEVGSSRATTRADLPTAVPADAGAGVHEGAS
jgi:hypothetical protein